MTRDMDFEVWADRSIFEWTIEPGDYEAIIKRYKRFVPENFKVAEFEEVKLKLWY